MNNNSRRRESIFVGRVQEQKQFRYELQGLVDHQAQWAELFAEQGEPFDLNHAPRDDFYARIFILHGIGGIGKTELTRHCVKLSKEVKGEPSILAIYDDVSRESRSKRSIRQPIDLIDRIATCLSEEGYDEQMMAYKRALTQARQVRNKVNRYKIRYREEWNACLEMAELEVEETPLGGTLQSRQYNAKVSINDQRVKAKANDFLIQQMQDDGKLEPEEIPLFNEPLAVQAHTFVMGLKQIACERPLVIALDTLEQLLPTIEPFLRDYLVLPTTDAPIVWILSSRHNIGDERSVVVEGQRQTYKGYRDLLAENPPLIWDMKTFSEANIRKYLKKEMARQQQALNIDDELVASIKITTAGVPLAMQMVTDALFAMSRESFRSNFTLDDKTLLPAKRVEEITKRFLRYCLKEEADLLRVRGMALLLAEPDAHALRAIWALPAEQRVPDIRDKMRISYAFMRVEGLHDAVYEFVRRELRTKPDLSEIRKELGKRAYRHYHTLWQDEHKIACDPALRTREPRWQAATRHFLNTLFWTDPDDAMLRLRLRFIEALGFDRDFATALLEQAQEFRSENRLRVRRDDANRDFATALLEQAQEFLSEKTLPIRHDDTDRDFATVLSEQAQKFLSENAIALLEQIQKSLSENRLPIRRDNVDSHFAALLEQAQELLSENRLPIRRDDVDRHFAALLEQVQEFRSENTLPIRRDDAELEQAQEFRSENTLPIRRDDADQLGLLQAGLNGMGRWRDFDHNFHPMLELLFKEPKIKPLHKSILHLWEGRFWMSEKEYKQAFNSYEKAKKNCPEKADELKEELGKEFERLGHAYYKLPRYQEAIDAYQCAIELDFNLVSLHNYSGMAYHHLASYEEAIAAYECAIELDPKFHSSHNNFGYTYNKLGCYEEAIEAFERAIELDPKSKASYKGLGNAYKGLGRYEEAIAAHQRAIELDPKFASAYNDLSIVYNKLGRYQESIAACQRAIKLDPKLAHPHNGLGNVYYTLKRYEEAIAAYQRAIELDPKSAIEHNGLGIVYNNLAHYEEAIVAYQRAIELDPKFAAPHNGLGNVYYNLARYQEAIAAYQRATELDPKYVYAHNNLGLVYYDLARYEEAIAAYQRAIELDLKSANPYNGLGYVYRNLARYEEAIAAFEHGIELDAKFANAHNGLGHVYNNLARYQEAIEAYQCAIELKPKYANPHNGLGLVYNNLAQYQEAIKAFQRAIELDPKHAYAYSNLAGVYVELGELEEAIPLYDKSIELKADHALPANAMLGVMAFSQGKKAQSQVYFKTALSLIDPPWPSQLQSPMELLENEAIALLGLHQREEALKTLKKALAQRAPGDVIRLTRYDLLAAAPEPLPGLDEMRRLLKEAL